jgi:hypothetical protein
LDLENILEARENSHGSFRLVQPYRLKHLSLIVRKR